MKKTLLTLLCVAALALPAQAQNTPTILVVDVGAVFNGYGEAQAAQLRFTSAVEKANTEITDKIQQASALAKQAQDVYAKANNTLLTQDARDGYTKQLNELKAQLDQTQLDINNYKQTTEQQLQERRQSIVQTQFDAIRVVVVDIAKKRKASLVLNSSGLAVVYADPTMDITKDVLTALNAGSTAAPAAAKPAAGATGN